MVIPMQNRLPDVSHCSSICQIHLSLHRPDVLKNQGQQQKCWSMLLAWAFHDRSSVCQSLGRTKYPATAHQCTFPLELHKWEHQTYMDEKYTSRYVTTCIHTDTHSYMHDCANCISSMAMYIIITLFASDHCFFHSHQTQ